MAPAWACATLTFVCFFPRPPDGPGRAGQSPRRSHLHRHRPPPVHHPELRHHRRHVERLRDREGNARPAHGLERGVLQAGDHRGAHQLTEPRKNGSQLARRGGGRGGSVVIGRCSLGIYSGLEFLSGILGPSCGREWSHVLYVGSLFLRVTPLTLILIRLTTSTRRAHRTIRHNLFVHSPNTGTFKDPRL